MNTTTINPLPAVTLDNSEESKRIRLEVILEEVKYFRHETVSIEQVRDCIRAWLDGGDWYLVSNLIADCVVPNSGICYAEFEASEVLCKNPNDIIGAFKAARAELARSRISRMEARWLHDDDIDPRVAEDFSDCYLSAEDEMADFDED